MHSCGGTDLFASLWKIMLRITRHGSFVTVAIHSLPFLMTPLASAKKLQLNWHSTEDIAKRKTPLKERLVS